METDVTRLLSASMYTNDIFRNKIIGLTKDRYHNISESIGTDTSLILKHAVNARRKERKINYILFIPTLLFAIAFLYLLASNDEMAVAIMFLLFLLSYIIVLYFDVKKTNFLLKELSKDTFNTSFDIKDSLLKILTIR